MRKLILSIGLSASILFSSCLGEFALFNSLKDWNQQATENRFVNNLLFWGLNIVPVYPIAFLADSVVFNLIEFWSGENPVAMKEGDIDEQLVNKNGKTYKITATKNNFEILVVKGENEGEKLQLTFLEEDNSWNAVKDGELIKLSSWKDGFNYVYTPDGTIQIPDGTHYLDGKFMIEEYKYQVYCLK